MVGTLKPSITFVSLPSLQLAPSSLPGASHLVKPSLPDICYCVCQFCDVIHTIQQVLVIGDSVELPKWLNSVSGTKNSAKSNPSCLVEGTLSIGWHWGFKCSEC